jgi:hypothetical protein
MGDSAINFTQGVSTGGPGVALIGVDGTLVVVSNGDDSNIVNWKFTVVDVGFGSAVSQGVVQNGGTPTWSFTPDVSGSYVVDLVTTDNQGNLFEDRRVFAVLETNGLLIPSFTADAGSLNFSGQTKGWSPYLNAWLKLVLSGGSGTVTSVTGTLPVSSTGGSTPVISIRAAAAGLSGSMSGGDYNFLHSLFHYYGQPVRLNFSNTGQTLTPAVSDQMINWFLIDDTSGATAFDMSAANMPAAFQDGAIWILQDDAPGGSWGVEGPPVLSSTDGTLFQVPGTPDKTSTTITCPPLNGGVIALGWDLTSTTWRVLWMSAAGSLTVSVPGPAAGVTGNLLMVPAPLGRSATYEVTATMRVTSTTGGSEAVGDTYMSHGVFTWKNLGGTQSAVPNQAGQPTNNIDTNLNGDPTAGFTQVSSGIGYQLPATLDASTVVEVTISYAPKGTT